MSEEIKLKNRINCPLCKNLNDSPKEILTINEWCLVQCQECLFIYMPTVPIYERMKEELAWERNFSSEKKIRFTKKIRRSIKSLIKRNKLLYLLEKYSFKGNILDVGCGSGVKFDDLPEKFIPFGIDISLESANEAKNNFEKKGGSAICAPATDVLQNFEENFFSAVVLRSYLEHEHNPLEVLEGLRKTIKNNGVVIIKVPNYGSINRVVRGKKWCGYRFPDHVNQFTPNTLSKMVLKAGYKIIKFNYTDKQLTSDNMWMVARPS